MSANSANLSPIFTNAGNMIGQHITTANTASDGSGVLVALLTGSTDGTRVDGVQFKNAQLTAAASSNMVVRVFVSDTTGANFRLFAESAMGAATRSVSAVGATTTITFSYPLILRSGQILSVAQSVYAGVQDQNAVFAFGGNY